MNEDRTNKKSTLAPSQSETTFLHAKDSGAKHGAKYLVEFLMARKQMQIAAHKPPSGR